MKKIHIGAHLSKANGFDKIPKMATGIGATAAAFFLSPSKSYFCATPHDSEVACFRAEAEKSGLFGKILPHGCYLINLAKKPCEMRDRGLEKFEQEVRICAALGIDRYNIHPGSNTDRLETGSALALVAEAIDAVAQKVPDVKIVLENMAGQGNVLGAPFEELAAIIRRVQNAQRVGVCLDTAHMFGYGYDVETEQGFDRTMRRFSETVGGAYLCGMHINDSKVEKGSRKDRHESLGSGNIGTELFWTIANREEFADIPLVLETPDPEKWAEEIRLMHAFAGVEKQQALLGKSRGKTGTDGIMKFVSRQDM